MSKATETLTLTDFLLARIGEDEAAARACTNRPWAWAGMSGRETVADMEHIGRHSPARVLAECEAKRRIVEWHQPATGGPFEQATCTCEYDDWSNDNPPYPCPTLRYLTAVYADHPDYREEWKP